VRATLGLAYKAALVEHSARFASRSDPAICPEKVNVGNPMAPYAASTVAVICHLLLPRGAEQ